MLTTVPANTGPEVIYPQLPTKLNYLKATEDAITFHRYDTRQLVTTTL